MLWPEVLEVPEVPEVPEVREERAVREVRMQGDRRRRPTPLFSRYWLRGRRRAGRRAGEIERIYVDAYRRGELVLAAGLVALSTVDLLLTAGHLSAGGAEVNPMMAWTFQEGGAEGFAAAKLLLTLLATVGLLTHLRFRLARRATEALVVVYLCLMVWHVVVLVDRLAVAGGVIGIAAP